MTAEWLPQMPGTYPPAEFSGIDNLPGFTEQRLQAIKPRQPGHYSRKFQGFVDSFIAVEDLGRVVTDYDGIYFVGSEQDDVLFHFDFIYEHLHEERKWIEAVSKQKLENLFVFIGNGETMEVNYRNIGRSNRGYLPRAILGAHSIFLNTDGKEEGEVRLISSVTAYRHEFRHMAINYAIEQITGVPWVTDKNNIIHEACGGPSLLRWKLANTSRIYANVEELDRSTDFWRWYTDQSKLHRSFEPFFQNPIARSFYQDYVYARGDDTYWFEQALNLATVGKSNS